jgi:hypothetical protein
MALVEDAASASEVRTYSQQDTRGEWWLDRCGWMQLRKVPLHRNIGFHNGIRGQLQHARF